MFYQLKMTAVAAVFAAGTFSAQAGVMTDLWWQPEESGWGANVIQQDDMSVITLFVYGSYGEPVWYIAPNTRTTAYTADLLPVMSGPLYRVRGPWFGGPFDPNRVEAVAVGEVVLEPRNLREANFRYRINGIDVQKVAKRYTFTQVPGLEITGQHHATVNMTRREGQLAPQVVVSSGYAMFESEGSRANLSFMLGDTRCQVSGQATRDGRFGQLTGTFDCGGTVGGTAVVSEIEVARNGYSARVTLTSPTITWSGRLAAARR
jgi:hypothetical protein